MRSLAAQPGFSIVVILTLALAIGINSTIFSLVDGVLLRPLDYADPGRLVVLWESNPQAGQPQSETSGATYLDWRQQARTLSRVGAFRQRGFTLTGTGEPEHIASVEASPALFRVLGVQPVVGRVFTDEEELPGHERLAILSYGAWQRRFGGRSNVAGQTLQLDGQTFEVVGVMPKGFQFPPGDRDVEVWSPLTLDVRSLLTRPHRMYRAIGRLAPGVTMAQAQSEMDTIAQNLARQHPDTNAGWGVRLVPAHDQVVGGIGRTLWVLLGAVVLVLLIACANVSNLMLARSARAARNFSIRAALGAGRLALVRQSLVESGLLSASGAVVGLGLAWAGVRVLRRLIPATVPRADQIGLDLPVLAFTAVIAVASGLLVGPGSCVARDAAQPHGRAPGGRPRDHDEPPRAAPGGRHGRVRGCAGADAARRRRAADSQLRQPHVGEPWLPDVAGGLHGDRAAGDAIRQRRVEAAVLLGLDRTGLRTARR